MPNQGTVMDWRRSTRGCEFLRSTIGSGRKRYFFAGSASGRVAGERPVVDALRQHQSSPQVPHARTDLWVANC